MSRRILVCGGRDFAYRHDLYTALDALYNEPASVAVLIHGDARGADTFARDWARTVNIVIETYPADWTRYGNRAGYLRNVEMLTKGKPDLVVAAPGGAGTRMMINLARRAGVAVIEVCK